MISQALSPPINPKQVPINRFRSLAPSFRNRPHNPLCEMELTTVAVSMDTTSALINLSGHSQGSPFCDPSDPPNVQAAKPTKGQPPLTSEYLWLSLVGFKRIFFFYHYRTYLLNFPRGSEPNGRQGEPILTAREGAAGLPGRAGQPEADLHPFLLMCFFSPMFPCWCQREAITTRSFFGGIKRLWLSKPFWDPILVGR